MYCAFYEKDITPPLGCIIPGYFNARIATDVKDNLYVKSIAVKSDKEVILIIAIDSCFISDEMNRNIIKRIKKLTGIISNNVIITATHTHTGGPIDNWGKNIKEDRKYVDMLCRLSADCAVLALKRLQPATVKFGKGLVDSISYNRIYKMKDGTIKTNPERMSKDILEPYAGIDSELPILFIQDLNGKPMGAVINFACHQDCVDGTEYSGDFSSILSKELKKVYGNDFVSLFVAGTCGNINHFNVKAKSDSPDHYVEMGKILANEVVNTIKFSKPICGDNLSIKKKYVKIKKRMLSDKQILDAEETIKNVKENSDLKIASDSDPDQLKLAFSYDLLKYNTDKNTYCDVCVQAAVIGNCLLYALPGEVFVQFGEYIKKNSKSENVFIATLCNGAYGYIPTRELFLPDVYESKLGSTSFLEPEAGYIISEKAVELMGNLML